MLELNIFCRRQTDLKAELSTTAFCVVRSAPSCGWTIRPLPRPWVSTILPITTEKSPPGERLPDTLMSGGKRCQIQTGWFGSGFRLQFWGFPGDAEGRPKWELFGIEMSPDVARRAEKRTGAKIFVGDILDAPFPQGYFDVITCFHVFEHMYQPKEILEKVSYWLKPGGIFYMMVPNIHSAGGRTFKSYWYALELPRHLFHWSPKALRHRWHRGPRGSFCYHAPGDLF